MLELFTLGELRLQGASEAGLSSRRKELTLLCYLARRSPRAVGRADLAELLWGERNGAKSRQSLRQALSELKRLVGDGLDAGPERVSLRQGVVRLDAAAFEQDLGQERWSVAVERWKADFLQGQDGTGGEDFRSWLEAEREGLRRGLRLALSRLVEEAQRTGSWSQGVAWAERWVSLLPYDEEGHRRVIELNHLGGRTAEALVRFAASRRQLEESGVEPSPGLVQLGQLLERDTSRVRAATPGSAALFTPDLVGRGPALAELISVWKAVLGGRACTVLVEGEAGIGKSRLCEEFLRTVGQERLTPFIARARGHESTEATPLSLIQEAAAGLAPAPGLAGASPRALAELAGAAPLLKDRFTGLPEPLGTHSALEESLVEILRVLSDERPLVIYIENVPRSDGASQRVLRSLIARASGRILFLFTARTGEHDGSSSFTELASEFQLRRLKLQALSSRDIEALLVSMLELPASERQHLAQRLYSQSGGNPFYTIELTAAMVDEELLTPTESGTWKLAGTPNAQLPLPASVREAVSRRLERLTVPARMTLEAAAVLGRAFDASLLPAVSGLDFNETQAPLEELISRRMVRQSEGSESAYEFTHDIISRVAYDLLPARRREALHRAATRVYHTTARRNQGARVSHQYHRSRAGYRPGRWRRRALTGLALMILVGSGALALNPAGRRASLITLLTRRTPALVPNRIVIAPLANQTGDTTLAGVGTLAADWIAQGLMRTTQFEVVDPRTSTIAGRIIKGIPSMLRDRNPAVALAEETRSGTVVSGDLYQDGDSLRALVRVIDATTGKIIRAVPPVSGPRSNPSLLVAGLGKKVLAAVASAVDTTSRGFSAALGQPPSYEAYSEVSRAWESFFREDMADVFSRLQRATDLDSEYMTPLLMRAYVQTRLSHWSAVDSLVRQLERHVSILTPAERAVLSGLEADLRGDLWARLRAARELMNLTPASVEGYTLAASSALFVNRPRESLQILSQIDPDRGLLLVAPFYWLNQTPAFHQLGDHRAEITSARAGLRRFPDRYWTHLNLLLALAAAGDVRALHRELSRVTRDDPDPAIGERQKAFYAWRELRAHGHPEAAQAWLDELLQNHPDNQGDTSVAAVILEGDLQSAAGHWDSARILFAQGVSRHPDLPILLGRLGTAAVHVGDTTEARSVDALLAGSRRPYLFGTATYARARIAAALGEKAAAVDLLRVAWYQGRSLTFDDRENEDVHSDPEFDSLRNFYPFLALVRTD